MPNLPERLTPAQWRLATRLMIGICLPGAPGRYGIVCHGHEKRTGRALARKGIARYSSDTAVLEPTRDTAALALLLHITGHAHQHAERIIAELQATQRIE